MENKTEEILNDIKANLKIKDLNFAASLNDLGLDSLDVAEYLLGLEEKYHIEFSSEEMQKLETLQDLVNLINSKVNK
jgi:acyl carrier protein